VPLGIFRAKRKVVPALRGQWRSGGGRFMNGSETKTEPSEVPGKVNRVAGSTRFKEDSFEEVCSRPCTCIYAGRGSYGSRTGILSPGLSSGFSSGFSRSFPNCPRLPERLFGRCAFRFESLRRNRAREEESLKNDRQYFPPHHSGRHIHVRRA